MGKMTTALTVRADSDFIDAIRSYSETAGLSVNAALKEIIAPVIGFARRSSNMPRNDLVSFRGALKDVDCSELEATQARNNQKRLPVALIKASFTLERKLSSHQEADYIFGGIST